jgi:hypothetical protein
MWLSHTQQSLSIKALEEAILASDPEALRDVSFSEREILSCCAGLVRPANFSENDASEACVVLLSHQSVQRYLDEIRNLFFRHAYNEIVAACITHWGSEMWYGPLKEIFGSISMYDDITEDRPCITAADYHL